jgi:hypothetical protein
MAARFPIRFTGANRAMVVLGLRPATSHVTVDKDTVAVRMSWGFSLTFQRSTIRLVSEDHGRVWGWGVHGWRGQWLVNGSSSGLVRFELDPPTRGRLLLLIPVKVRVLRVSVEDPAGLVAAVSLGAG